MSMTPEFNNKTLLGEQLRQATDLSLRNLEFFLENYKEYKFALDLALNNFLSEKDLSRVLEIRSELHDLGIVLQKEQLPEDADFLHRTSWRLLELTKELGALQQNAIITEVESPNLFQYNQLEKLVAKQYEKLTTVEAIYLFPKSVLYLVLIVAGFYVFQFAFEIKSAAAGQIGNPYAQAIIVSIYVFLGILVVLIFILSYAAFFAKPKSQRAADAIFHFLAFFGGAIFGILGKLVSGHS